MHGHKWTADTRRHQEFQIAETETCRLLLWELLVGFLLISLINTANIGMWRNRCCRVVDVCFNMIKTKREVEISTYGQTDGTKKTKRGH